MASVTPPSSVSPVPGTASAPPPEGQSVEAQAKNLPRSLENNARDVHLRGTVQGQNPDGTTRINTPRGPVDVPLPQPLPARGTQVSIEIPAGNPPRSVTVTLPAPPQPAPAPQAPPPQIGPQTPSASLPPVPGQIPQAPGTQPPATPASIPSAAMPPAHIPTPSDAPAPHPQQALPSGVVVLQQAADPPDISPQHLLDFLKTSLQIFMKAPALPTQATGNTLGVGMPEPTLAGTAQRALQVGQMVRLTPLAPGQVISAPASQPGISPFITHTLSQTIAAPQMPAQSGATATPNVIVPQGITFPAPQTLPLAQTSVQSLLQVLLKSPAASAPAGQAQPPTPGLTKINLIPPQAAMPGAGKGPGPVLPPPVSGAALVQSATPGTQQFIIAAATHDAPHLIPSGPLDVRVSAVLPGTQLQVLQNPGMVNLVHGAATSGPVLFAQVSGQTAQGLPVVKLPTFTLAADGTVKGATTQMVLQFPARGLGDATILKLDLLPGTHGVSAAMPMTGMAVAKGLDAQGITWEALDEILHAASSLPAQSAAANPALAAIPKPGAAAFTAPVLMFVAALRGGDISGWMGDKGLESIRGARRADALARITGDFTTAMRSFREEDARPPGEWRSVNLPMAYGGELNRLQLHYRSFDQGQNEHGEKIKSSGTRFIMDLALTRMGPMQIDGFSLGKKLDVTLRSEQALSPPMREAMRKRYFDAISAIGFAGELNFSADAGHKNWIDAGDHRSVARATTA